MYKILKAGKLAGNIYEMVVEAPRVAKHCLPGQFIIVKMDEVGERFLRPGLVHEDVSAQSALQMLLQQRYVLRYTDRISMTEKPVQLLLYSSRSERPQRNLPH